MYPIDNTILLVCLLARASSDGPMEHELDQVNTSETTNNRAFSLPPPPTQSDVPTAPVDTGNHRLYSEIENAEAPPPDSVSPPPPVYQHGSRGFYEGLQVVSRDSQPAPVLEQPPRSIYDQLCRSVLSGCGQETLVKVPHVRRVRSLPALHL